MPEPFLDLRPDHLQIVCGILKKHVPEREVWAFGSRAQWRAKPYSDLDLAVLGEQPLSLSVLAALTDDFADSDLPFRVDVVDWATTRDNFRRIIERDKVVVQEVGEWKKRTLGEFVRLQRGHDLTASEQQIGNVPIMGSAGPNGTHNQALVKGPGVVIGRSGASAGRVHFSEVDYWPHNTCLYVTDFMGNNPRFAYYLLRTLDLAAFNSGSAQPSLNRNYLYSIPIKVPLLHEQDGIVNVLQTLDDRITLLRETNTLLEQIAQTIFKSWFIDFDPVRAKHEGRIPEGMDEDTAALFPDSFEESELGWVPRGWQVIPLGEAVETVGGATPDTKNVDYWSPEEYSWTSPKDLSGLQAPVLLRTERKISAKGLAKVSSGLLPEGTLLMSSRAPIGYLAVTNTPMAINQGYIAMPPGSTLPPSYMLFWCQQNMEEIKNRANGSTFMEISKKAFRPIPVLVPDVPVISEFVSIANSTLKRVTINEEQAQILADLRDTLLPRLISGKLRLPEAEEMIQEAVS